MANTFRLAWGDYLFVCLFRPRVGMARVRRHKLGEPHPTPYMALGAKFRHFGGLAPIQ